MKLDVTCRPTEVDMVRRTAKRHFNNCMGQMMLLHEHTCNFFDVAKIRLFVGRNIVTIL